MPYTATGPFVSGGAPGISATFLNNVETCLTNAISDTAITNDGAGNLIFSSGNIKRKAGSTESGGYWVGGGSQNGWYVLTYVQTTSRNVTPVSVSINTAGGTTGSFGGPSTSGLSSNGFEIYITSTASQNLCQAVGTWTVQY